jgi:peptide deformylase
MPVLPIVRLGHPALRTVGQPLAPDLLRDPHIQQLIDDMVETMRSAHGIGLAAPQVGAALQLFVYGQVDGDSTREPAIPLRVVVNPMLTPQGGELIYDWEGCLSIPDLRGLVPRHPAVRVRCLDRDGQPLDYLAADFEARVVQHEFDHLNGVVFLDRMRDFKSLAYLDEWEQYLAGHDQAAAADPSQPADPSDPPAGASAAPATPAAAGDARQQGDDAGHGGNDGAGRREAPPDPVNH